MPRTPPRPPAGLTADERKAWSDLWRSPVSALWRETDEAALVVRLIRLRQRIDDEGVASCPVSLFAQVASLEDRLILTPRARRREGINLVPTAGAEGNGRRNGMSARERERLLRG